MTIIVDTLSFCHYPGFFGFLLGIFQYIPTVLVIGSFFWSVVDRDSFFLSLALTMKIVWVFGLILKYVIFPFAIPSSIAVVSSSCESFVPTFLNYVIAIFIPNNQTLVQGSEFPQIDVLLTGVYLGYVLLYYLYWRYPIKISQIIGLLSLSFVPWSFLSSGSGSYWAISVSIYIGIIFGCIGLFTSYYIYFSFRNKKTGCCFNFWCGKKMAENDRDLFMYNYQEQ